MVKFLKFQDSVEDGDENVERSTDSVSLKNYRINPKTVTANEECSPLDDLLNLIDDEGDQAIDDSAKHKPAISLKTKPKDEVKHENEAPKIVVEKKLPQNEPNLLLVEKNTKIRLCKAAFHTEPELNSRLAFCGQFYKLSQLRQSMQNLKENGAGLDWYTIILIGSKTEPKCSARGNKFVIWHVYDLDNLERDRDVSLFLFGAAYTSHWKSSEFEVYAVLKPDFLDSNEKTTKKTEGLSLCVRNEAQLIKLGVTKDVSRCQYTPRAREGSVDQAKPCWKLVNLQRVPLCAFHCMQANKSKAV